LPAARRRSLQAAALVFLFSLDLLVKFVHIASTPLPMPQVAILPSFDGSKMSHFYLSPPFVMTVYSVAL
jgi:hypothetical protein